MSRTCECDIGIFFISRNNKLYQYSTKGMDELWMKYLSTNRHPDESYTNKDVEKVRQGQLKEIIKSHIHW